VIGAAHAGWRGALGGVTDAAIAAMESLGAQRGRIAAAVGPCIAQSSYEVDDAFRHRFDDSQWFVAGSSGKPHFDLSGYVTKRLRDAGIDRVETLALDTYADSDRFFSYRRSTHRGEADYGRQLSLIALRSRPE
jgi:copper oxidase (laccase) domain-containing protein